MSHHPCLALVLVLLAAPAPLGGQSPPPHLLGPPVLEVPHEFSRVGGVAELAGGRLLVADSRDHLLHIVDLATGRTEQLGRQGQGPGEYQSAFGVVRVRGDTVLVYDPRNSRFLQVTPGGAIAGSLPISSSARRGGLALPRGADAAGRLYWDRVVLTNDPPAGMKRRQTLDLVRWLPGSERVDTIGTVADHAPEMHAHRFHPFAQRDAWIVTPEGRVGVLVAATYRLRWLEPGGMVRDGPLLAHAPLPVTEADREAFREYRAMNPAGGASLSGPAATSGPTPEARRRASEAYPDAMFPRHKPPFEENGAWLSPGGEIWVVRSRPAGDPSAVVDVLDSGGVLRRVVRLPPGTRLVALERGGIYLVRTDADGLEFLQRYAWPAGWR